MNAVVRRRLEMAARARDFLRAHRTEVASEATALARLEELLARAETLAAQQQAGVVATRSATVQREELRREIQKFLRFLVGVGAVGAKGTPVLAEQFRLPPTNANNQAFLTRARVMLQEATTHRDVLMSLGLSVSLLDDLAAALGEFEKTLEATRSGRRDHVGASADLDAVATEIAEQVRLLDGLVRYRFGDNAELMGAWISARNVLGPFRSRSEPQAGEGETPTDVGPNVVKPAA
jgi:hypothetical protein